MTDALRSDRSSSKETPDRERDARVEGLLLSGLDHYFTGHFELAINVWTRVLFLDRGHARARAYIERARSAVAERQREADELFHAGATALRQGDHPVARQLLTSAIERGAGGEEALALLQQLDRLEAAGAGLPAPGPPRASRPASDPAGRSAGRSSRAGNLARDPRIVWVGGGVLAGVLLAIVAAGYLWIVADSIELEPAAGGSPLIAADPLPVPSPGELRVLRARHLVARGRLHEALTVLEAGRVDERDRQAVDDLRASIQRTLIEAATRSRATLLVEPPVDQAPAPGPEPGTAR